MEKIVKVQRERHDAHDLLLGILYYFPEEAKWDELSFHEALFNNIQNYKDLISLDFEEVSGNFYCEDLGKVFDLLELSGLLKRKEEVIMLDLFLIKSHFDEEINQTFNDVDVDALNGLSLELQKALNIA